MYDGSWDDGGGAELVEVVLDELDVEVESLGAGRSTVAVGWSFTILNALDGCADEMSDSCRQGHR